MLKVIQKLEDAIKANQGGFLGGDTPGAVDYILWPWIERIGAVKLLRPGIYKHIVQLEFVMPPTEGREYLQNNVQCTYFKESIAGALCMFFT